MQGMQIPISFSTLSRFDNAPMYACGIKRSHSYGDLIEIKFTVDISFTEVLSMLIPMVMDAGDGRKDRYRVRFEYATGAATFRLNRPSPYTKNSINTREIYKADKI